MSNRRYILPDDESPLVRLFFRLSWGLFILAVICGIAAKVCAQDVLVPCYEAAVGEAALKQTTDASRLVLIVNVNSGPHEKLDKAYDALITKARARKAKLAFYIDLIAGPDYSPVVTPQWKITVPAKVRLKTAYELKLERTLWSAFYGSPQWWFIDDVRDDRQSRVVVESLSSWAQPCILNPGTSYVPPATLPSAVVVIHESEGGWPRALTGWEGRSLRRCAAICLQFPAASLPAFTKSTAGMAMRYASPLSDAQGAYDTLTPYFTRLLR